MKKLLFIAAAAAGMVAVADVESANVVGYAQTVQIKPGLNLLGTTFLKVDDMGRPDLNSTFTDCREKSKGGEGDDTADYIQVFNNSTKVYTGGEYFFYKWQDGEFEDWDYKWMHGEDVSTFVIPTGNAFWYWSRGDKPFTLTTSGAVATEDIQITIKPGLNLIVNPFPCAFKLNSDSVNWKEAGAKGGEGDDTADYIQIFNNETKVYTGGEFFFYKWQDGEFEDWDWKWMHGEDVTDFEVPAGGGFWYTSRNDHDITLTFKSPIQKK